MKNPKTFQNLKVFILLLAFFAVILISGSIYLIQQEKSIKNANLNNQVNLNQSSNDLEIIYTKKEIKSIVDSKTEYKIYLYASNLMGENQNQIYAFYEKPGDVYSEKILANGNIAIINTADDFTEVKIINKTGEELEILSLPSGSRDIIIDQNGETMAYAERQGEWSPERIIVNLKVILADGTEKEYTATDFLEKINGKFSEISPLAFSKDGKILYVRVWPTSRGGDENDPFGIYQIELSSGKIEEIIFSGSKELDYTYSEEYPSLSDFYIIPNSDKAITIMVRSFTNGFVDTNEVYLIDLLTKQKELLLDSDLFGEPIELQNMATDFISPDLKYLALARGITKNGAQDTYNKGYHLFNMETKKLLRDVSQIGNFESWADNTHVLYNEYRNQTWDDQYYTLKVMDIGNNDINEIYTQTTNHVQGAKLSEVDDSYYEFLGIIN